MSTALQERIFGAIRDHIEAIGVAPTISEIAEPLRLETWSVRSAIDALVQQGRLTKTPAKTRNLAIVGAVDLTPVGTEALRAELARRGYTFDALAEPRVTVGRACAASCCISKVVPGQLMCRPHWFALPQHLRQVIMNSFRARDVQAYRDAVATAIDLLDGHDYTDAARRA